MHIYNALNDSIRYSGFENITIVCISYFVIDSHIYEWHNVDINLWAHDIFHSSKYIDSLCL
jgi:hypothetical protein